MHNQHSLETLRTQLQQRGLPRDYVERVIAELDDHKSDVVAEQRALGQSSEDAVTAAADRLGEIDELVDAAVSQYQGRTFCGRHPVLAFVLAPIPAVITAWVATFLVAGLIVYGMEQLGVTLRPAVSPGAVMAVMLIIGAFDAVIVFAVPTLVAVWLCRRAFAAARSWRWMAVACALVGLIAVTFQSELDAPNAGPGSGRYFIGLGVGTAMQSTHALLPTLVGVYFVLRRRRLCRVDDEPNTGDGARLQHAA